MPTVTYKTPDGDKTVTLSEGTPISKGAGMNGIKFSPRETCHGKGECGLCKMRVLEKNNQPKTEIEKKYQFTDPNMRLGCQVKAEEGMVVEVPEVFS